MSDIETTRAFIERISELSSENNKLKSKLNAFEPMREALRSIKKDGADWLSDDALAMLDAALALADKEKP